MTGQSSKGVQPAPGPLQILRSILQLGDERLLDAVDLKALPYMLRRIFAVAWRYWGRVLLAVAATLGATIFTLAIPKLLGAAVDRVHLLALARAGQSHAPLWIIAGFLIAASTGRGVLTMIAGYQGEVVSQRVAYDLRLQFFEKLQRLGFDFHDRIHSGDLITRGMLDLEGVRTFVETGIQRILSLLFLVLLGAWLVFSTDPLLAVLSLSFVPVVIWRAARTGLFLRLTWTRLQRRMSVLTRTIEENLQGVRVVRAFAAKDFELARFDAAASVALRLSNDRILIRTGSVTTLTFAFYFAMGLVLLVGGHRVMSGVITIGRLTEFLAFMTVLQTPVRQITIVVNATARAVSSGSRLFEILDMPATIREKAQAHTLDKARGAVRFENVSFSYRPDGSNVLSDVSFEVRPGKTLGILGAPGAGKSTIAHLASRFYDVTQGRITLDGHDVRDLSVASLRRNVGTVQQDVFLFDSRVTDNVAYTQPDATEDRVVKAATTAQLHEYVDNLPDAYNTYVGERGVGLSGGQRQRLSIARGIMPQSSVLIFDDATSAVDSATEHRLRLALQQETAGRTTIIIAHRLSSLMHADEIIVLDRGRILERGSHTELLALGGLYAELYRLQADSVAPPQTAPASYALEREAT